MSTIFGAAPALPFGLPGAGHLQLHQRNSWRIVTAAWRVIDGWSQCRSQRLALHALTGQQLDDIGLSRTQALREAAKPFWRGRAPCHPGR